MHACVLPPGLPTQREQITWAIQSAPTPIQEAARRSTAYARPVPNF